MTTAHSRAAESSLAALDTTRVHLLGVRSAGTVISAVGPRRYLHAGPPLELDELPGPMRGAVIGGLIFEGEAADVRAAQAILDAAEVEIVPCHDSGATGAMAGIVTPRMPVVVGVAEGVEVYAPLNEGLGQALRFGCYDLETLARLHWIASVAGPLLDAAIQSSGEQDLTEVIAEGLRRGDECHNRNVATSAAIIARWAPAIVRAASDAEQAAEVIEYAATNRHFALPFSMVVGKGLAVTAHGVSDSPVVTAISGNGRRLGIRVSGAGQRWFTGPASVGDARFFEGYDAADATPTMGDSMITEVAGYGAFALTASPAITSFIGGTLDQARAYVAEMREICVGESTRFLSPGDDFRGTPLGIDVHRVARLGVTPVINNGIAHREAGRGQVGAGINRLPLEPFLAASQFLAGVEPGQSGRP